MIEKFEDILLSENLDEVIKQLVSEYNIDMTNFNKTFEKIAPNRGKLNEI